jgi:hypothetical protein
VTRCLKVLLLYAAVRQEHRRHLAALHRTLAAGKAGRALGAWAAAAATAARHRRLTAGAVAAARAAAVTDAFHRWRGVWARRRAKRTRVLVFRARVLERTVRGLLLHWRGSLAALKFGATLAAAGRLRAASRCLRRWHAVAAALARVRFLGSAVAARAVAGTRSRVMAGWLAGAETRQRLRYLLHRTDLRWWHRRRAAALWHWRAVVARQARADAAAALAAGFFASTRRARAVAAWRARARTLRTARVALAVLRWPVAVRAFARWRTYAAVAWGMRPALKRIVRAWRGAALRWAAAREAVRAADRCLLARLGGAVTRAWRAHTALARAERARLALKAHRALTAERHVVRRGLRAVAAALVRWRTVVGTTATARRLARAVALRRVGPGVWRGWGLHVRRRRAKHATAAWARGVAARAAAARALGGWRRWLTARRRREGLARVGARLARAHLLRRCVRAWRGRGRARAGAAVLRAVFLRRGVRRWRRCVRLAAGMEALAAARDATRARACLRAWRRHAALRARVALLTAVAEDHRYKATVGRRLEAWRCVRSVVHPTFQRPHTHAARRQRACCARGGLPPTLLSSPQPTSLPAVCVVAPSGLCVCVCVCVCVCSPPRPRPTVSPAAGWP